MPSVEHCILNLPDFEALEWISSNPLILRVRYRGEVSCPHCGSRNLRGKGRFERVVRHENTGSRKCFLRLEGQRFLCCSCRRSFRQRFAGIRPYVRSTELFRKQVWEQHHDGISQKRLEERYGLGHATIERWYQEHLEVKNRELLGKELPRVLGIDEHFFSRRQGYFTTIADLQTHKVFDLVLGRSEKALEGYLTRLKGRERVRVVVMDLSAPYRRIIEKYFPNAKVVADRFHVIRLVLFRFVQVWRGIDELGSKHRGLLSLMRRHSSRLSEEQKRTLERYFDEHPPMRAIYEFKESLN